MLWSLGLVQTAVGCLLLLLAPSSLGAPQGSGSSSKWQRGPTTTAKGQFSWFVGQKHGTRAPADSQGDVSKKFMMVVTNRNFTIYDMKANVVATTMQQGGNDGVFAKNCQTPGSRCILDAWELADPLNVGGDARVLYDKGTKRWYMTAFANLRNASSVNGISVGHIFLAVSTTNDPTKAWRVLEVPAYPYPNNRYWGDYPMLGFSKDKLVISMNYFPIDPYPETEDDQGLIVLDKHGAVKGEWSYQYIVAPPDAGQMFLVNQTGWAANPAVDVDNKRKDAYLVSSTNNDPTATLRVTTLHGLPPNVQYHVQAVNTPACEWPVEIPQPPNLLPNVAGDGRVVSAPKLRLTRVKGQKAGWQLRLYVSRTVSKNNVTNGLRMEVLRVHKGGPVMLESAFNIFSGTNKQLTYPSIAVNKAGFIGLGSSEGDGFGMGAALTSVNPVTGAVACVPPFPGDAMNHSRWGDYSATNNNPYCEGNSKGAGFCSFQMRGDGPGEKTWDVMAGCYCEKAFTASPCVYQPVLTVLGGSFAGSTNVQFPVVPNQPPWLK